jgi:hypothetical protein
LKIIEATWLKRNMGLQSKEIVIDESDTPAGLEQLRGLNDEYLVARVPTNNIPLMFALEDMGYRYIETNFDLLYDLHRIGEGLNPVAKRVVNSVSYAPMDAADFEELNRQLKLNIFHTDRVYVDPDFSREQAAQRYIGWFKDATAADYTAYKCKLKDRNIGFFILRTGDDSHILVAGMYSDYLNSGLGTGILAAPCRCAAELGAKTARGSVSSNNMPSLKANMAIGAQITGASCAYVKHNMEAQ